MNPLPFLSKSDDFRISPIFALTSLLGSNRRSITGSVDTVGTFQMERNTEKIENIHFLAKMIWAKPLPFLSKSDDFSNLPQICLYTLFGIKRGCIRFSDTLGHSRWGNKEDWKYSFFGKNDAIFVKKWRFLNFPHICLNIPFHDQTGSPYNSETLWDIPDEEIKKIENIRFLAKMMIFFGKNDELTYPLPFFSKSDDFRISPKFALTTFLGSNGDPYNSETLWDIPDEEIKKIENIHFLAKTIWANPLPFLSKKWRRFSNLPQDLTLYFLFRDQTGVMHTILRHCWDILRWERITEKIENITFFGKNDELTPCHFCRKSDDFWISPIFDT